MEKVLNDLEELIEEIPKENQLIRQINRNFGEVYLQRLTALSVSFESFQENQQLLDDELSSTLHTRKLLRKVRNWWQGEEGLTIDDLYRMQRECLDYMQSTLSTTLEEGKDELKKLGEYSGGLLTRLQRGEQVLETLQDYSQEQVVVTDLETVKKNLQVFDENRQHTFALQRLQQVMGSQTEHFQDVRNLLVALREVVEVYTLVHDKVVLSSNDLEMVIGGYRLMEQTAKMSPMYERGVRQLKGFSQELNRRLREGVKRLTSLKNSLDYV